MRSDGDDELETRTKAVAEAFAVFRASSWRDWQVDETTILVWVKLTSDLKPEELRPGALRMARTLKTWPTPADLREAVLALREEKNRAEHAEKWRRQAIEDHLRLKDDPQHGDWARQRLEDLGVAPDRWRPPY